MKLIYDLTNLISKTGDQLEFLRKQQKELRKQEKKLVDIQIKAVRMLGVRAWGRLR